MSLQNDAYHWVASDFIVLKRDTVKKDIRIGTAVLIAVIFGSKSRKENPQKLTQLSSRSHPRCLVGKRTALKDTIIDITNDSQVNSDFPYRWSSASLTFNNYFYLF